MTVPLVRTITKLGSSFPAQLFAVGLIACRAPAHGVTWLILVCLMHFFVPVRPTHMPTPEELIVSLTVPEEPLTEDDRCPFCYETEFTDPVALPCKHIFCRGCAIQVLEESNMCPYCRRELYSPLQCWAGWILDRTEALAKVAMIMGVLSLPLLLWHRFMFPESLAVVVRDLVTWPCSVALYRLSLRIIDYEAIYVSAIACELEDSLPPLLELVRRKLWNMSPPEHEYDIDFYQMARTMFAVFLFFMDAHVFAFGFNKISDAAEKLNLLAFLNMGE
ncbi:putative Zinc finger, RING-type [Septoria linicola]|nr:putative Zinc finger, RING-type [Septoria linicola]